MTTVHERLEFDMPAPCVVVFDAFHFHCWRAKWDSLVSDTEVVGGEPCPYVGAITVNTGRGVLRPLRMTTQFVSFERPRVAAAKMIGASFPFQRWAAGMQHKPIGADNSLLIYTYSYEIGDSHFRRLLTPLVKWVFARQTRIRFARLREFLVLHTNDVQRWQQAN